MPIIEWNNSFELGIKELDEHHMHLIELFNKMFDNFINGVRQDILESVLDELIDYAAYHFAAEEQWMDVHNYPKLGQHREEHARLSNRVEEIRNEFYNKKLNLYLELMQFLNDWVLQHILTSDADYNFYLKSLNCHILLNESFEVMLSNGGGVLGGGQPGNKYLQAGVGWGQKAGRKISGTLHSFKPGPGIPPKTEGEKIQYDGTGIPGIPVPLYGFESRP